MAQDVKAMAFDLDGTIVSLRPSYMLLADTCTKLSNRTPSFSEIADLIAKGFDLRQIGTHLLRSETHDVPTRVFVDEVHALYPEYVSRYAAILPG